MGDPRPAGLLIGREVTGGASGGGGMGRFLAMAA